MFQLSRIFGLTVTLLAVTAMGMPTAQAEVFSKPAKVSLQEFEAFLVEQCVFQFQTPNHRAHIGNVRHHFGDKRKLTYEILTHPTRRKGKFDGWWTQNDDWSKKTGVIYGAANFKYREGDQDIVNARNAYYAEFIWRRPKLSGTNLLYGQVYIYGGERAGRITFNKAEKEWIYDRYIYCGDETGCDRTEPCRPVDAVELVAAHKDRTLYERVKTRLTNFSDKGFVVIEGQPSRKQLKHTEIQYHVTRLNSSWESVAEAVKAPLLELVGDIKVSETRKKGDYVVRILVGKDKLLPPPIRVKVMDGTCGSDPGCTNPLVRTIATALESAGHTYTGTEAAKTKRTKTEVWFQAGKRGDAERLMTGALAEWTKGAALKEWKWGGDFDVLVIAAGN